MFWPFATSMEELMIYTGRADLFYYTNERYRAESEQSSYDHPAISRSLGHADPFPE